MQQYLAADMPKVRLLRHSNTYRSILLAGISALACVLLPAGGAVADQVIDSAASGPVYGDGGATSITNTGAVTGGTSGVVVNNSGHNITSLTNNGLISGTNDSGGAFGITITAGGTIDALNNTGTISGGTSSPSVFGVGVNYNGTVGSLNNSGTIQASGGSGAALYGIGGIGTLTNSGSLLSNTDGGAAISQWGSIGTINNTGTIQHNGVNYGIGIFNHDYTGTLLNSGTITGGATSASSNNVGVWVVSGSGTIDTLTNAAGGFIHGDSRGIYNAGLIGALTNAGTITGGGFAILSESGNLGAISNTGVIDGNIYVQNQNLTITGGSGSSYGTLTGGNLTVANGNLTFAAGNTHLDQNISVNGGTGTVTNNDPLLLTNHHTITGNYSQTSIGVLQIGIAGTNPTDYGSLAINGTAAFDGQLALLLMNSFTLASGETFNIASFASHTGSFSSFSLNGAACTASGSVWSCGQWLFSQIWSGTSYSVSVDAAPVDTPEPGTLGLFAAAVAGLGVLRRGRKPA